MEAGVISAYGADTINFKKNFSGINCQLFMLRNMLLKFWAM